VAAGEFSAEPKRELIQRLSQPQPIALIWEALSLGTQHLLPSVQHQR
jgi:hypothetical protein